MRGCADSCIILFKGVYRRASKVSVCAEFVINPNGRLTRADGEDTGAAVLRDELLCVFFDGV